MVVDLISNSFDKIGFVPINTSIKNLINESYYFGYKWKDSLERLTNYTHSGHMYKLINNENFYILNKLNTYVAMENFKIISIDILMCSKKQNEIKLLSNYQDNISIVESYMLDENNKNKVIKYTLKILENESIFSVMDSNYNLIKHNELIESSYIDGYCRTFTNISSLLESFIIPS